MRLIRNLVLCTIILMHVGSLQIFAQNVQAGIDFSEEEVGAAKDSLIDSLPPLDKQPELIRFVKAEYPKSVAKLGVSGVVILELLVNELGGVDSAKVMKGVHPDLDSSIVHASRQFKFTPAMAQGDSVAVLITYEYRVTLDDAIDSIPEYVNLRGTIVERGTRTPLSGIMVYVTYADTLKDTTLPIPFTAYLNRIAKFKGQSLEEGSLVATTDSLGKFEFKSLPEGRVVIKVPIVGYENFEEVELVSRKELTDLTYRIQRISYSDYEVVVYGKSERKEVAKQTLTINEIKRLPGFGGDALKVVQALPGVARPTFGGGAVVVRGAPTWDSRFYLDGVVIPQLYHFGSVKSTYNSDALQTVDLYPGGFSTRYGGGIAGVIEIKGREAKTDRWHGYADLNVIDASLFVEGPVTDSVSILAAGRRSYIGDVLGWVFENNDLFDFPITVAPYYWDYVVRTDAKFKRNQRGFLTLFGSRDGLELIVPGARAGNPDIDKIAGRISNTTTFNMGILGYDVKLTSALSNSLRYSLTGASGHNSILGLIKWDFSMVEHFIRNELTYALSDNLKYHAGIEADIAPYEMFSTFYDAESKTFFYDTIKETFGLVGGYLNLEWRPLSQLQVMSGIRYDHFSELNYRGSLVPEFWDYSKFNNNKGKSGEPSLRLTMRYNINSLDVVKFAIGNYSQTPQPMGIATHGVFGDPMLGSTKARHTIVGYERKITDLLNADVQFYYNSQWEIPRFTSESEVGTSVRPIIGDMKGRMYGMELMVKHDQGKRFFGWLAYTLSRSERFLKDSSQWVVYDDDQTHNLQLIGNYRVGKGWETGMRLRYVSGNPYTGINGSFYNYDAVGYGSDFEITNGLRNAPFFQIDLRGDKKFIFDKWVLNLYVDLQNISYFLYKSPEFLIPQYDGYNVKKGKEEERVSISSPFIPSFGLKAEF